MPLFCWRGSLGVDWNAVFPMKRIYGICLRGILSFVLRMWNLFRLLWMLGALGSLLDVTCGKWAAEETYPAWRKSRLEKKGALWAQREWRECQFRQLGQRYPAGDAHGAGAGIANFFQAPGKGGSPPTIQTNGSLGFSRMAY